MKRAAPPRVDSIERYWTEPPPERSPRCAWWVSRVRDGWQRNRRLRTFGYYESASYFGIYVWEWLNVLYPMFAEKDSSQ